MTDTCDLVVGPAELLIREIEQLLASLESEARSRSFGQDRPEHRTQVREPRPETFFEIF